MGCENSVDAATGESTSRNNNRMNGKSVKYHHDQGKSSSHGEQSSNKHHNTSGTTLESGTTTDTSTTNNNYLATPNESDGTRKKNHFAVSEAVEARIALLGDRDIHPDEALEDPYLLGFDLEEMAILQFKQESLKQQQRAVKAQRGVGCTSDLGSVSSNSFLKSPTTPSLGTSTLLGEKGSSSGFNFFSPPQPLSPKVSNPGSPANANRELFISTNSSSAGSPYSPIPATAAAAGSDDKTPVAQWDNDGNDNTMSNQRNSNGNLILSPSSRKEGAVELEQQPPPEEELDPGLDEGVETCAEQLSDRTGSEQDGELCEEPSGVKAAISLSFQETKAKYSLWKTGNGKEHDEKEDPNVRYLIKTDQEVLTPLTTPKNRKTFAGNVRSKLTNQYYGDLRPREVGRIKVWSRACIDFRKPLGVVGGNGGGNQESSSSCGGDGPTSVTNSCVTTRIPGLQPLSGSSYAPMTPLNNHNNNNQQRASISQLSMTDSAVSALTPSGSFKDKPIINCLGLSSTPRRGKLSVENLTEHLDLLKGYAGPDF